MKLNWNFLRRRGVQNKKPSVGGLWILSGTAQSHTVSQMNDFSFLTNYSGNHLRTSKNGGLREI